MGTLSSSLCQTLNKEQFSLILAQSLALWQNSECIINLMFFSNTLIWKIWVLVSPIIFLVRSRGTGMIACFLESPLVVCWIFLVLLIDWAKAILWISRTFLFGRSGNASLILRVFDIYDATWAYNIWESPLTKRFFWKNFDFSKTFLDRRGGIGGGYFADLNAITSIYLG